MPGLRFEKYHALGNDYLVVEGEVTVDASLAQRLCDRHRGVGADGVLVPRTRGERMAVRIVNPDGSEAEKSGNGLRILARYAWDHGLVGLEPFEIETAGGVVRCHVEEGGRTVIVEIGRASFQAVEIPCSLAVGEILDQPLDILGSNLRVSCLTLGNPHCVVWNLPVAQESALTFGPIIERHPSFPARTNVQFAEMLDAHAVRCEIWERGAGYTLSSGTSACAVAAAAIRRGVCCSPVAVFMAGGRVDVAVSKDQDVTLRGDVAHVATGSLSEEWLESRTPWT